MSVSTENLDVYIPLIDERDEETIYQQASDRISAESLGQLNDFSDNSPAGVLLRAQCFTFAELLFKVNKLPLVLLLSFLSRTGVERVLGNKAIVTLVFELTAPRPVPFTVPANFEVSDASGQYRFFTSETLVIPVGQLTGSVTAVAAEVGEAYNLPSFRINSPVQPLTFLASVTNPEAAQNGTEEESVESAINRGIANIRQRNLVSAIDFNLAAENVLGSGSRATTIGLLGADKISRQLGAIHVFCATAQDTPSNFASLQAVRAAIQPQLMLGSSLYVSPMEFSDVNCRIILKSNNAVDVSTLATDLWDAYRNYLSLKTFDPGDTVLIEEVRYRLRQVIGVQYIDYIILNGLAQDVPMPNKFTLPSPEYLVASISTPEGAVFEIGRGALDNLGDEE